MAPRIYVIDDEQDYLEAVGRGLKTAGFGDIILECDPRRAAAYFMHGGSADIALIDVAMPGLSGAELLQEIQVASPGTECIMVTALDDAATAVQCLRRGAYDYLLKPLSRDDLVQAINRALERSRLLRITEIAKQRPSASLLEEPAFKTFSTRSPSMLRVLREAKLHAESDVPVLITGETGTGKELLARAIHASSRRAARSFTPVNMAALTSTLFDAEFFGHTKGAFTGAERDRAGYFEHGDKGTLFLDEIGTLSPELQGKLLRVLQEQEYTKVGSSTPRKSDLRFIAATNADLERMLDSGAFRRDLYYRLKVAWLHLPPLRERKEDIPLLVDAFLYEADGPAGAVGQDALELLMQYDYPGNVRELKSIVQAARNLSRGKPLTQAVLPETIRRLATAAHTPRLKPGQTLRPLGEIEKEHILRAYTAAGENKTRTAEVLGIGLNTLRRKLKSYGIR